MEKDILVIHDEKTEKKTAKKASKKNSKSAKSLRIVLTHAQEEFLIHLMRGESQRVAYRLAYPNCKAADRVVDVKACALMKMDKVRVRYEALLNDKRRAREQRAIIHGEKAENELLKIAFGEKKYPSYDMTGKEYEKFPSMGQRIDALKELRKDYSKILEVQTMADLDVGSGQVEVNIRVIE